MKRDKNRDENEPKPANEDGADEDGTYTSQGMAIGMCLGAAVGAAFMGKMGTMSIVYGVSLGMVLGLAIGAGMKKK